MPVSQWSEVAGKKCSCGRLATHYYAGHLYCCRCHGGDICDETDAMLGHISESCKELDWITEHLSAGYTYDFAFFNDFYFCFYPDKSTLRISYSGEDVKEIEGPEDFLKKNAIRFCMEWLLEQFKEMFSANWIEQ